MDRAAGEMGTISETYRRCSRATRVISDTPRLTVTIRVGVMSALGQKQTHAVQQPMSALPPIATAKADIRKRSCLLYPQEWTLDHANRMSGLDHERPIQAVHRERHPRLQTFVVWK